MKKGILLILLLSAVFLISCGSDGEGAVQNGIVIVEDTPVSFSKEINERAENAVFALVKGYYEKTVSATLPEATLEKIRVESRKVTEITQKHPLSEQQYVELIACLEENKDKILDACTATAGDASVIKALYKELSALTDPEYVSDTVYQILSLVYDYKYTECMERYEKYGYSFLLSDAEQILREKTVFENEIGKSGFAQAAKIFFFFAELLQKDAFEQDMVASFSDEELLTLLKNIDFDMEGVTPDGFALLLSYLPSSSDGDYFSRLWYQAKANGDITLLAERMDDLLRLLCVCRDKLDEDACEYIRKMDMQGLLRAVFAKFDEEAWNLFERVVTAEFRHEDYAQIAEETFGRAYFDYLSHNESYTLDEVKQSVGTEDFSKVLKGYLVGICPAFVYGMNND